MKEKELRDAAICEACKQPFGHTGLPLFWRVRLERHGVIKRAMERQDGLAMQLGSAFLAQHMGVNEEMTQPMMEPIEFTLCETCAMEPQLLPLLCEDAEVAKQKQAAAR